MNNMGFNHKPEYKKVERIHHIDNLRNKMLFLSIFATLIVLSLIIFCNSNIDQSNIDEKVINKHHLNNQKSDHNSNIEIQIIANVKRMLTDTQINTWMASNQTNPQVSSLSNGYFVVVWQSYLEDGNGWNIYGQIFYSNGKKMGNEFSVSNYITFNQTFPHVATSSNGKFMVVWQQNVGNIFGQIFMNDGTKLGYKFQINTNNSISGNPSSITALNNNNFVVTWDDGSTIYSQIFTDNGNKFGMQFAIAPGNSPSITSLSNGNFVVAYNYNSNIYAKVFYSNGTIQGPQFIANTFNCSFGPISISSASTSNFMIIWESVCQDGYDNWGIYGRNFTSSGAKIGNEFRVNTYLLDPQIAPSIKSLANDNYIATWESIGQDGSGWGVYGQIFDHTGNKIGREFKVNTITYSDQQNPSVASLINTNFVIVWQSYTQDGDGYGIFGNLYQKDGSTIGFDILPLNCQSCTNLTYCNACDPNFELQSNGLCGCFNGFYLDTSINLCISKLI